MFDALENISHTSLEASQFLVRALGLVSSRYDWGDVAAGLAVAVRGRHGRRHPGCLDEA